MSKIKSEVVTITPEMASQMLCHNTGNREVRDSIVAKYMRIIARGEWKLTHQGIAFDVDGKLVDGQHRLMAIVRTETAVQMMVTRGVDPETFGVLDQGARRTAADILHLPPRIAEVINFASRVYTNETTPSAATLEKMNKAIGPVVTRLVEHCNSNATFFSSAPMKLGAVSRILLGEDEQYVLDLYGNLCRSNVDMIPPVAAALVKAHLQGRTSAGNKTETMAAALYIFNQRNKNFKQLRLDTESAGEIVRAAISAVYDK
jgi:hypothetical protein